MDRVEAHGTGSRDMWAKSSFSGGSGNNCLELNPARRGVRDSKAPERGHFTLSHTAYAALIDFFRET